MGSSYSINIILLFSLLHSQKKNEINTATLASSIQIDVYDFTM